MGFLKRASSPVGMIGCTEDADGSAATCGLVAAEVYFRPLPTYQGEFGVDWMRVGDTDFSQVLNPTDSFADNDYRLLVSAIKGVSVPVPVANQAAERNKAFAALEQEYGALNIKNESYRYHHHWLALFPKTLADSFNASFAHPAGTELKHQATLNVVIKLKDLTNKPDRIIFIHKETAIVQVTTSATPVPSGVISLPCNQVNVITKEIIGTITINSIGESEEDITIRAYAVKGSEKPTLAGILKVCKNHSTKVCRKQNVLVALIKTNINGSRPRDGNDVFNIDHLKLIYYALHQSLLYGEVEQNSTIIDLTNDIRFRLKTSLIAPDNTNRDAEKYCDNSGVMQGNTKNSAVDYLNRLLPNRYSDYAKLFTFAESWSANSGTSGVTRDFSSKMAVNFTEISYFVTTPAHEMSHSMGLKHTFGDHSANFRFGELPDPDYQKKTDNIMSYSNRTPAMSWHWQWKIMNPNLK